MDTLTCTAADLEQARQAHIGQRLAELQEAVRAAEAAMVSAPNNVLVAEQATADAMKEHDKAFAAVKKKLVTAGLGIDPRIAAGNGPASEREFAYRINQATPVREAALKVKQARSSLNTLRGGIEATREEHSAACAALAKFCNHIVEGN